jgi:hypothetical protein
MEKEAFITDEPTHILQSACETSGECVEVWVYSTKISNW